MPSPRQEHVVDVGVGITGIGLWELEKPIECSDFWIVEGQIHGGLTQGLAPAMYEELIYDEDGNILNGSLMDYLVPTAVETPNSETDQTVTPSPHHPLGAKGVAESPTVGAPPAIANAVIDALSHLGIENMDIPITPYKIWKALKDKKVAA